MRCKIVRFQKLIYVAMKSTKSQKVSILHYSIDNLLLIDLPCLNSPSIVFKHP